MGSQRRDLPELKIGREELKELRRAHADLTGFVLPRALVRTDLLSRLDPELLRMQQEIRRHCMHPGVFDTKTSQLMISGMLLMALRVADKNHGIAARRAGATWEEMQAVASMAYLFGGLSIANRAAEMTQEIAEMEAEQRIGGEAWRTVARRATLPKRARRRGNREERFYRPTVFSGFTGERTKNPSCT